MIRQALRSVRYELSAAKVATVANFAGQLPTCSLDWNKTEAVLVNLFTNACHAMPGGGQLSVSTRAWRVGEETACSRFNAGELAVIIEVADTGTGIPAEQVSKIFDHYFTTKPTGKGTGLGLTVSKSIIDLHGGRIHMANRPEGGVMLALALQCRSQDERS